METIDYEVCSLCLIAIANDDFSGHEDHEIRAYKRGLDRELKPGQYFVADGEELGFSRNNCEICGEYAGERYKAVLIIPGVES